MKQRRRVHMVRQRLVAPRRGAWVETSRQKSSNTTPIVAPRRGAWVETQETYLEEKRYTVAPRRGAWVETLDCRQKQSQMARRTPQGCVG